MTDTVIVPALLVCGYFFLCLLLAYDLGRTAREEQGCCWTRPEEGPREPIVGREGRLKRDAALTGHLGRTTPTPPGHRGNGSLPSRPAPSRMSEGGTRITPRGGSRW